MEKGVVSSAGSCVHVGVDYFLYDHIMSFEMGLQGP